MDISIICALAKNRIIGKDNKLLWHLPDDLKRFKRLTTGHHIIMGRKTWESLGCKALPNRTSVVITHKEDYKAEGAIVVHSLQEAIETVKNDNEIFIIGGGQIYEQAMKLATKMYLTVVDREVEGDTLFPEFDKGKWKETSREQRQGYAYFNYEL